MKVIYIAGKYRGPNAWAVEQNIRAAEEVAAKVWAAGHVALCPHSNARHMLPGLISDDAACVGNLELLRRCDAVVLVPNWRDSEGARDEVAEADFLGLPVFGREAHHNVDEVVSAMVRHFSPDLRAADESKPDHAPTIERLDFTRPPPGYEVAHNDDWGWRASSPGQLWCRGALYSQPFEGGEPDDANEVIELAWADYMSYNDPPGMQCPDYPKTRAEAWAYYCRRLALADRFQPAVQQGLTHLVPAWPGVLTWSDELVIEAEEALRD